MPPRLQCLNVARNAISSSSLGMRFSTSRFALAETTEPKAGYESIQELLNKSSERAAEARQRAAPKNLLSPAEENQLWIRRTELTKQIHRRWRVGDVYAPHDLTGIEMAKWKKRGKVTRDVFDIVAFDPIATGSYKNFSIMSEYVSAMGRIRPRNETGLRPVNQRKIAKAIRRSVGLGLMPSVHKHPEILYQAKQKERMNTNYRLSQLV